MCCMEVRAKVSRGALMKMQTAIQTSEGLEARLVISGEVQMLAGPNVASHDTQYAEYCDEA